MDGTRDHNEWDKSDPEKQRSDVCSHLRLLTPDLDVKLFTLSDSPALPPFL